MKRLKRYLGLLFLVLVMNVLAPRVGYGSRTYVQGLAKLAKTLLRYIQKHETTLRAALAGNSAALTCLDSLLECLIALAALLNESAA